MVIGIFWNSRTNKKGGLERYIFNTIKSLIQSDSTHEYIIYVDNDFNNFQFEGTNWKAVSHNFTSLKWRIFGQVKVRSDIYIFFTPVIPLFLSAKNIIVVFLDAAFLHIGNISYKKRLISWMQYAIQRYGMARAKQVVTISKASKLAAVNQLSIQEKKINVIYPGYTSFNNFSESWPVNLPKKPHFLYVGPLKKRKNTDRIIEAFVLLCKQVNESVYLIIAGRQSEKNIAKAKKFARNAGFEDRLLFLGHVTDNELAYLYKHSVALVFPSLLEGFGLPVLEAMDSGCPVVTSNISSLPEVAGNAALLVDPYNIKAITLAMHSLFNDNDLVSILRERGYKRAKEFSWEYSAECWKMMINQIEHQNT